jgi:hypothetical protein
LLEAPSPHINDKAPAAAGALLHAPVETKIKLSSIDEFVDELLDPAGRDRRRRAVQLLNGS